MSKTILWMVTVIISSTILSAGYFLANRWKVFSDKDGEILYVWDNWENTLIERSVCKEKYCQIYWTPNESEIKEIEMKYEEFKP